MELWYTEKQTKNHGITTKIRKTLYHDKTDFQSLDVIETVEFGKMLVLDGMVMTTDRDEFVYHEMITHVAMNTHPDPKEVLVVGGGDGGVVREVLRHSSVTRVVLAEIDGKVIEASKKYFPQIAGRLDDERVDIQVTDGIRHIQQNPGKYDVIIVDSTEPVGPAEGLFQKPFYEGIYEALKEDGIMVAQTESPWFNRDLIRQVFRDISAIFPIARLYTASIPTYPSGLWSFTIGSKKHDPLNVEQSSCKPLNTRYYRPEMHRSLFDLPQFVLDLLTDRDENDAV
ncbi:MAG: polyamine aminopropyltransferase [Thermoactinomyces sp.]